MKEGYRLTFGNVSSDKVLWQVRFERSGAALQISEAPVRPELVNKKG